MELIEIEGKKYRLDELGVTGRKAVALINFARDSLAERINQKAILNRAMNSYIEDLKQEIIQVKSGVTFATDPNLN
jgi:hypothetical protein